MSVIQAFVLQALSFSCWLTQICHLSDLATTFPISFGTENQVLQRKVCQIELGNNKSSYAEKSNEQFLCEGYMCVLYLSASICLKPPFYLL